MVVPGRRLIGEDEVEISVAFLLGRDYIIVLFVSVVRIP